MKCSRLSEKPGERVKFHRLQTFSSLLDITLQEGTVKQTFGKFWKLFYSISQVYMVEIAA